jgi:4-coumarate--CoA ligase
MLEPDEEKKLASYIEILAPAVIVVRNQSDTIVVDPLRRKDECPFMGLSLGPLAEPPHGWTSVEDISAMSFPDNQNAEPAPDTLDRISTIIFTSGTSTGSPKACLRTVRDLVCPLDPSKVPPPLRPPIALVNTKNSGSVALCLLYASWYTGNAAALVGGTFSPEITLSTLATCRPLAISIAYPMIVSMIAGHTGYSREKVRSVRYVQIIGAVTTVEGLKRAQEVFPKAKIIASYGMTEAASLFGWPKGSPKLKNVPTFQGIVAAGVALPGIKFKIVDENGHVLDRNEPGVLHLSGPTVTKGYVGGVAADMFYMENNCRWYITGDCAVLDEYERIYILGRSSDMIRNNDTIIAPATIENLLMQHFQSTVLLLLQRLFCYFLYLTSVFSGFLTIY